MRTLESVVISVAPAESKEEMLGNVIDLSQTGVRFHCIGEKLRRGHDVNVSLTSGDHTTSVIGKVVRVKDLAAFAQEVALAFVEFDCCTPQISTRHEIHDTQPVLVAAG